MTKAASGTSSTGFVSPSPAEIARTTWAAGEFQRIANRMVPVSEDLVLALDVLPGERVLDIAGGTGNTALAAARRDARVTCVDVVPELLDHARLRADVELLPLETVEVDAAALPFADGEFDVVTSTFGLMFVADQRRAAAEALRVLRPGGRIGLANWTPDSALGGLLHLVAKYAPPPADAPSPLRWGTRDGLAQLLAPYADFTEQRLELRCVDVAARSVAEQFRRYRQWFGPVKLAVDQMSEEDARSFEEEFAELWDRFNRGEPDAVVVPYDYLQFVATVAGPRIAEHPDGHDGP
ncbi:Ubiquinone/menaquinone biosynthesis C-methylase UbiE [Actinopolymorpha cephalotaxi]|uniref:SAM-dependent methyltransferase n=1 Tax=Actinopolymorpha cephalotaxi TaxID=504797 RepID=A0A1I3BH05_9ACTN|nr:class I SAM-dependent methyltransferase [Actinopolymorpha cephalotaxi]NYH86368.1 SAM-dependent methyltransferase [Actinopolymorpha cephalotaxi]SFH61209.1 Ubiquinone/menaquinone biosynthesis C-methylase UbiE [Actinopolymorpha cephalotaxi]